MTEWGELPMGRCSLLVGLRSFVCAECLTHVLLPLSCGFYSPYLRIIKLLTTKFTGVIKSPHKQHKQAIRVLMCEVSYYILTLKVMASLGI